MSRFLWNLGGVYRQGLKPAQAPGTLSNAERIKRGAEIEVVPPGDVDQEHSFVERQKRNVGIDLPVDFEVGREGGDAVAMSVSLIIPHSGSIR